MFDDLALFLDGKQVELQDTQPVAFDDVTAVCGTLTNNNVDVVDVTRHVVAPLKQTAPILTDIWFVDEPARYQIFMSMCNAPDDSGELPGLTLHNWESSAFDPDEEMIAFERDDIRSMLKRSCFRKHIWPWVCGHHGIWARFNNGRWQQLDINETNWREIADGIRNQLEASDGLH